MTVYELRQFLLNHNPDDNVYIDAGTERGPIDEMWKVDEWCEPGDRQAGVWLSYDPDGEA